VEEMSVSAYHVVVIETKLESVMSLRTQNHTFPFHEHLRLYRRHRIHNSRNRMREAKDYSFPPNIRLRSNPYSFSCQ